MITELLSLLTKLPVKANVLIDGAGQARLADFGLLTITSEPTINLTSSSHTHGGTPRWMGPELIAPQEFGFKNRRPTKSSDCYALGMVVYETISGQPPFHEYNTYVIIMKVVEGERPSRAVGFTDRLWKMLRQCWAPQPDDRPSVEEVLQCLRVSSKPPELLSPWTDESPANCDSYSGLPDYSLGFENGTSGTIVTKEDKMSSDLGCAADREIGSVPSASCLSTVKTSAPEGTPPYPPSSHLLGH